MTMTPEVCFRRMNLEDLAPVLAIEHDVFTLPWSEEAFVQELTGNQWSRYVVAVLGDEVVGYGGVWVIVDEAHVTNIAVARRYQAQGIGTRLVEEMQKTARFFGAKRMTLEVRVSNAPAIKLYARHGFVAEGVRPRYYSDNQEDALIMWADLE